MNKPSINRWRLERHSCDTLFLILQTPASTNYCGGARYLRGKVGLNTLPHQFAAFLRPGAARRSLRALLATVCLLGCAFTACALEPTTPLASYGRQSWGMENGLPQNTVKLGIMDEELRGGINLNRFFARDSQKKEGSP